ncbi:hypothetical protein N7540_007551 [Penicillium herquei]|nr:hypothetical protein N7540_007551 [Penicillium herquei]
MAQTQIAFQGQNDGCQIGENHGDLHFHSSDPSEVALNQTCLHDLATTNPHHDKDRIEDMKGGLLKDSYAWVLDNSEFNEWRDSVEAHLLWIKGDPGKGKTMLLCGIIDQLTESTSANVAYFFCQASDARINSATSILRGLIYLLVEKQPYLLSHVREQYDKMGKRIFQDTNSWQALSKILTAILEDQRLQSTFLFIDALDECVGGLHLLLDLICRLSSCYPHIKWIVTSRNWPEIEESLQDAAGAKLCLELNESSISDAVNKYIQHKIVHLARVKKYSNDLCKTVQQTLSEKSQGTFLWVALACQELSKSSTTRWRTLSVLNTLPKGLDGLYRRMIEQITASEDAMLCKQILAIVSTVYRPLTLSELTSFADFPGEFSDDDNALIEIIGRCGSFLTIRGDLVLLVHQSVQDFLTHEAFNETPVGAIQHRSIFSRSLNIMSQTLRRDIYGLKEPGFPIERVQKPDPDPLASSSYSCVYWIDHLEEYHSLTGEYDGLDDHGPVYEFLQQKFIYWLEALSLLGNIPYGIKAIAKLENTLKKASRDTELFNLVADESRFIRYHMTPVEQSPLQLYCSALFFSPTESLTRRNFKHELPEWVTTTTEMLHDWGPCLNTLEGHSAIVNDITWSPDETQIVSASGDTTMKIWDSSTGECISTLREQDDFAEVVKNVFCSSDGLIASVSKTTVNIWDPVSQHCINTLEFYNESQHSPVWLMKGRIACFIDNTPGSPTVEFWDPVDDKCTLTLEIDDSFDTYKMTCSCNGHIACPSDDNTVTIWDSTGRRISVLEGHSGEISYVKWSEDGKQIATCSEDESLRIWNADSGVCTSILVGHEDLVVSCSWSSDGKFISSSSSDGTEMVWNTAGDNIGECISTFHTKGHRGSKTLYWCSDGRIASNSTLGFNIWHSDTGHLQSNYDGHPNSITTLLWSSDGTRIVSASWDETIKIWDATVTNSWQNSEARDIEWSRDGSRLAITSVSIPESITVWDLATGECIREFEDDDVIEYITWSPHRDHIASGSDFGTVKIWSLTTDQLECVSKLPKISDAEVFGLAWSHDGSQIAWVSSDGALRAWNFTKESYTDFQLPGIQTSYWLQRKTHLEERLACGSTFLAWSYDGSKFALISSVYDDILICDLTTKSSKILENPRNHYAYLSWSSTGYLASISEDKNIRVWDESDQCKLVIKGHTERIWSLAWSHDASRIVTASVDETVMIWDAVTGSCVFRLDIYFTGYFYFDPFNSNKLHTGSGTFLLDPHLRNHLTRDPPIEPETFPKPMYYGLSTDATWVTYKGINLLALPPDYRPGHWGSLGLFGTNMVIDCVAVGLLMLKFPENPFCIETGK